MCPHYKNKKVFDGFNEIVEALGGRPLTEEEFSDSALRNQRTGSNYSAMEAAYKLYHRNNGNFLDKTPNGETSILFLTLLDELGDKKEAINAKSKIYSDSFKEWFGDWINDPENASKVVDENGEPLVVYHASPNKFPAFDKSKINSGLGLTEDETRGFYFSTNPDVLRSKKLDKIYAVFLNARKIGDDKNFASDEYEYKRHTININTVPEFSPNIEGVIHRDVLLVSNNIYDEIVVFNPNQIKSAISNIGSMTTPGFSTTDNDINKLKSPEFLNILYRFERASLLNVFNSDIFTRLEEGKVVSSKELVEQCILNGIFDSTNLNLAHILSKHDIPVKIDNSLGIGTLATTVGDKTGGSVILLNANTLSSVSKNYVGITLLHEITHAVTVNAINNPITKELLKFVKANNKAFVLLSKAFIGRELLLNSIEYGAYALKSEKEFASVFMTDSTVRELMYDVAHELDVQKQGKVITAIKDFVNSLTNLLINKSILNNNVAELDNYRNLFKKYLTNQPMIEKGNILSTSQLMAVYKTIDKSLVINESVIEATKDLNHFFDTLEYNSLISVSRVQNPSLYQHIEFLLQNRKNALTASNLAISKKQSVINTTNQLLDLFADSSTPQYVAISSLVSTVIPQLIEDADYLRNIHEDGLILSSAEYMYHMHSNFVMFQSMFNNIKKMLLSDGIPTQIIQDYNSKKSPSQDPITTDDLKRLADDIGNVTDVISTAILILNVQNNKINANIVLDKAKKAKSLEGEDYAKALLRLDYSFEDISGFWKWAGSVDSMNNESLRILANLLDEADNNTMSSTLKVANSLITAVKALKKGEKVKDLYEMYKGNRTGYLTREVNFGQFYANYDAEMKKINSIVSKTFDIVLDPDNRKAPNDTGVTVKIKVDPNKHISGKSSVDMNATEYWNYLRNRWLSDNCERRYTLKYYDAWASVPQCAKEALDDINSQIRNILVAAGAIDEHGYRHFEKLSEKLWKEYNKLQIERKLLYSDYDQLGNLKTEGDVDYKIAKALQKLHETLYSQDQLERKKNRQAWEDARNAIINDPTKTLEDLDAWDLRNSRLKFREDEGHNVWDDIEQELNAAKPSYGQEDLNITEEIKAKLKPYRLQNGEILADEIPETVKNTITNLYIARKNLRKKLASQDAVLREKVKAYNAIFDKYLHYEPSAYVEDISRKTAAKFTDGDFFDSDSYYIAMLDYGYFLDLDDSLMSLEDSFQYSTWNKRLVAVDKEKYMTLEPGDGWTERDLDSQYLNSEFKKYEHYGSTMVPKLSLYKNKQWDKISKQYDAKTNTATGSLGNLYKLTLETITEANKLQSNRIHSDNYLLPQVMASSLRRLIRSRSKCWKEFFKIICEKLGFIKNQDSYLLYNDNEAQELDAEGHYINKKIVGSYADGRSFNTIPLYYTKKLDDPSMISGDLVDMLISYHRMSKAYSEKTKIKNDCEAIVDKLQSSTFEKRAYLYGTGEKKQGENSNVYKAAREFLDMLLYGLFVQKFRIRNFDVTIAAKTLKQYTTAVNLGMSPKIAIVGFLTSMWTHLINAVTGQKYGKTHLAKAFFEVTYRLGLNWLGIKYLNNDQTTDKLMILMQECNLANRGELKGKHTNRLAYAQGVLGNTIFGMLSTFDFLAKSNILVSTFKAHRVVDGEFVTMDDLERLSHTLPEDQYQQKLKLFKESKDLYSVISDGKRSLMFENEKYRQAWEKSLHVLKDRVLKYAEDADGIATPLLKALMSHTLVGSFFLIHRLYLGLNLQQRWGDRVYDYDTRQYKNHIFRTATEYFAELFKNNVVSAGAAGAMISLAFGGYTMAGISAGVLFNFIYKYLHKGQKRKSISEFNKDFFGLDSPIKDMALSFVGKKPKFKKAQDEKEFMNKRLNFYDIKRILSEVLIYNFILAPLVSSMAQLADDDDDNNIWLQMLAYWLRAFQWEAYTSYRPTELLGSIKSATAASGTLDKISNTIGSLISVFTPAVWLDCIYPLTNLVGTALDPEENYYSQEITRGAYSHNEFARENRGWTRREQTLFKMTPMHNFYELFKDSKSKRKYIENQIMHLKEDGSSSNSFYDVWQYIDSYFSEDDYEYDYEDE